MVGREARIDIHMKTKTKTQKKNPKTNKKNPFSSERNGGKYGMIDLEGKGSFDIKGLKKCEIQINSHREPV